MHVSPSRVEPTPTIAPTAPTRRLDKSGLAPASADSVSISSEARALAANRDAVDAASDVRADRVNELKQRIAEGTYSVPAEALARKLLKDNIV